VCGPKPSPNRGLKYIYVEPSLPEGKTSFADVLLSSPLLERRVNGRAAVRDTRSARTRKLAVKHALRRLVERGLAEFRKGDYTSAPFPFSDQELDVLHCHAPRPEVNYGADSSQNRISNFSLTNIDDFLKEVWRVLKPGGRLVMTIDPAILTHGVDSHRERSKVKLSFLADKQKVAEAAGRLGFQVKTLPEAAYRPVVEKAGRKWSAFVESDEEFRKLCLTEPVLQQVGIVRRPIRLTQFQSNIWWGVILKKPRSNL